MLLLDLSHTSHTRARTGIQRVARSLFAALGSEALPICHDPFSLSWRTLERWERANLASSTGFAGKRGAQWPLAARWRGRLRRWTRNGAAVEARLVEARASALIVPEVFSPALARALPEIFRAVTGPRVAIFHDAIALQYPELTPAKTVARFPAYLHELLAFDGIAAVSEDSRQSLLEFWRWAGVAKAPPVVAIPLGLDPPPSPLSSAPPTPNDPLQILCVASLEGRKNHLALLDACEALWNRGERFALRLIGLQHPQTGRAALERVHALQGAGRPLRYDGPVDDATLEAAYRECDFTVYPSLIEGFGLPVLESVARGKPCICSARGAIGESARPGGCKSLESVDAASLAAAIGELLTHRDERSRLAEAAKQRRFRTWSDYARELTTWLRTLKSQRP